MAVPSTDLLGRCPRCAQRGDIRPEDDQEGAICNRCDHENVYDGEGEGEITTCDRCDGEGWIINCCDDICHGMGRCIHGSSGYKTCPQCKGAGEL
jgi:hypothetical protein